MKRIAFVLLACVLASAVFADDMERGMHRNPFASEIEEVYDDYRDRTPASLTFAEMEDIAVRLSVPRQKAAFVQSSAAMSFLMPGAGQFRNRDFLSGALFLTADLAIVTGTAVGLYFLLPPELRFDQLDYFNATSSDIEAAWENAAATATLADALPFWGVATGGMLLKHVVSYLSARHAGRLALQRIEAGEVTFTPRAGFFMGHHGPGIGMSMKY